MKNIKALEEAVIRGENGLPLWGAIEPCQAVKLESTTNEAYILGYKSELLGDYTYFLVNMLSQLGEQVKQHNPNKPISIGDMLETQFGGMLATEIHNL